MNRDCDRFSGYVLRRAPASHNPRAVRHVVSANTRANGIQRRGYAIRDRYLFPLTEQEKMAMKLKEEEERAERTRKEHKDVRKALKSEMKYAAARPGIQKPSTWPK